MEERHKEGFKVSRFQKKNESPLALNIRSGRVFDLEHEA